MALFSTRAKAASKSSSQAQSSTVLSNEEFKRRAKNRLIGSFVLVVFAVLGFTWLLDSQPRPAINDVPVIIPSLENSPNWSSITASDTLASNSATVHTAPASAHLSSTASNVEASPSVSNTSSSPSPSLNSLANLPVVAVSNGVSSASKPSIAASSVKPAKTASESKFAQAASMALTAQEKDKQKDKLQDKQKQQEQDNARKKEDLFVSAAKLPNTSKPNPDTAAASSGQFIIQVGAYADVNKAKEIKSKLEAAGLTAFTQNVKSNGVDLIRVRVGPFASKNAAEQNTAKVKALGLSAIVSSK